MIRTAMHWIAMAALVLFALGCGSDGGAGEETGAEETGTEESGAEETPPACTRAHAAGTEPLA